MCCVLHPIVLQCRRMTLLFVIQAERRTAEEKVGRFSKLLKITQTDQLLKQYHLDQPDYLELSVQGALLIITLYTDLPASKKHPSELVYYLKEYQLVCMLIHSCIFMRYIRTLHMYMCTVPPVHEIATEIAQVHSIKLDKIRQKLAEVRKSSLSLIGLICLYHSSNKLYMF